MKENKLSSRKQKILRAVVDEYIRKAAPVSSGEIKAKYFDDISSATIRAELSTLEDMGYLVQPHTSAGRVPAPKAYKYYVENFLDKRPLRRQDIAKIDATFNAKFKEIEEIVRSAAKIISDVTNYTSVIVIKNIANVVIKEIKLVGLDENSALVIIITDGGIIRDKVITVESRLDDNFLSNASLLINKVFGGRKVGDLKSADVEVQKELSDFKELFESVLSILLSYCEQDEAKVFVEGESKILEYPEASLESAKSFLTIIDDKSKIMELLEKEEPDIEFSIKIGKEETKGMDKCAVVAASYTINGKEIGKAGVIGPERMDYGKVISVLSYVRSAVNTIFNSGIKKIDIKKEENND
ncbi:MAG TPA: heat-inducible transcriptional repressor HrcA [Clostridia bacterium]|jgi:heat-inducible transcriptional repressor|nr:heat-inducible transcriptional repressor HrcA [Clostridia bacterium]HOL60424.1 heat-inducible transcriptional repressor HrcA [Clostridia bacterium]